MIRPIALALIVALVGATPPTTKAIVSSPSTTATYSGQSVDLYDILQAYARHAHFNLYIDSSTPHTPQTFVLRDVTDEQALKALVDSNGLVMRKINNIVVIGTRIALASHYSGIKLTSASIPVGPQAAQLAATLTPMLPPGTSITPQDNSLYIIGTQEAVASARAILGNADVPVMDSYAPTARSSKDLVATYTALFPYTTPNIILPDPGSNVIFLRGSQAFVTQAKLDLAKLDLVVPQVFYDVSEIEIEPEAYNLNRGVLFGGADATGTATPGTMSTVVLFKTHMVPFNMTINALESTGKARVLRRMSVSASNLEPGQAQRTQNIPYAVFNGFTTIPTINQVQTGVLLKASATVIGTTIHTHIEGSYTVATGEGVQGIPTTETDAFSGGYDTLPDEQIVVSGFYGEDDSDTQTGVPVLSHLILIGGLFRNHQAQRTHAEVILVMQAHIDTAGNRHLPVDFPSIPADLIQHGIAPAPTPTPTP